LVVARDLVNGGDGILQALAIAIEVKLWTKAWGADTGVRSGGVVANPIMVFGALGPI